MFERTFQNGIEAERIKRAEAPTEEIPVEAIRAELEAQDQVDPTRLQRFGNFLMRGLTAYGQTTTYGSVRMGYIPRQYDQPQEQPPAEQGEAQ